jgi:putative PEP-CTERM system TPR-repeat lipoprotein
MTIHDRFSRGAIVAAVTAVLLVACGGDKPEALVASGRDYLAKNDVKAAIIQLKNALQKNPGLAEARFLLGKALLQNGDPAGAEVELRKALDAKYAADQTVPLLAQALLATGQAKKLLTDLEKVELTTPESKADFQTSVAMAHAALGHMDKAKASIDAALALKPDHARTLIIKARLLSADNDAPGALGLLEAILTKDAKNYEAWSIKGDILSVQGNSDGALDAYRKAVAAKPDFAGGHAAIIRVLLKQDKLDEAGVQLEVMKKALPKNPQALLIEAEYLMQKKEFKRALEVAQDLLKIAPDHPRALLVAGAAQFQLNSLAQAEDNLARAVRMMPGSISARRMLALVHLRTGQPAKALSVVEPILDKSDKDSGLLSLAGDIYMQNGNPQKAEEYFSKAAALDPKNATKQTKVALTHLVEGKGEAAFGELERIASADSGTTADMALIATAIRGKEFGKALKAIDALEKKRPDDPMVYSLRGTVLAAKGDSVAGRKSLEKALSVKPGYFPAAAGLASLDLKDNKPDDAKKRFEGVLAVDPKNFRASLVLANLQAKTGAGTDEVAAQIAKAIQASPGELAPRLALINFLLQSKDAKKALTAAQEAETAMPDRVEVLELLARAQQETGDTNQALATCGKLTSLMPGSPHPYLRMADINIAAKNNPAAIQNLRKALELQPDLVPAQRNLIMLYVDAQNFRDALAVVEEVKKQRPKDAVGFLLEGDIAAARKAWPEAVAIYRAGLKEVPSTELAIRIYAVLGIGGKAGEADKFGTTWLADHPQDAGFRMAMAERAVAQKDFSAAVRHYQVLLQTQSNNPVVLNNLAWALSQLKDPKAIDYAEKANLLAPNQPAIMETLGTLLAQKGETARALQLSQKALDLAPQSAEIRLSLAKVQIKAGKQAEARKNLDELAKLGERFPAQAEVARLLKENTN